VRLERLSRDTPMYFREIRARVLVKEPTDTLLAAERDCLTQGDHAPGAKHSPFDLDNVAAQRELASAFVAAERLLGLVFFHS